MAQAALRRACPWALCALLAAGCVGGNARARAAGVLGPSDPSRPAEDVFSILWWSPTGGSQTVPYRPFEPASPAVDPASGNVFAATSDGKVHAFGAGGRPLWEWDGRGPFSAGPTYAFGRVYVGTSEGQLVALDAATGRLVWAYAAGEELVTRPEVSETLVYVVSASDTVFAVDRETGQWRWQYRRDQPGSFTLRGAARPLASGDKVFAGFADGYAVALAARDGSVVWARAIGTGAQFNDVDAGPVADDFGNVYFAAYSTGLHALEGETGNTVYSIRQPGVTTLAIDTNARLLVAGGVGFLGVWGLDDAMGRWKLDFGSPVSVTGLSLLGGWALAATGSGPLLFVDLASGRVLRAFNPGRGVSAAPEPAAGGEAVLVSNRSYVYKIALHSGAR